MIKCLYNTQGSLGLDVLKFSWPINGKGKILLFTILKICSKKRVTDDVMKRATQKLSVKISFGMTNRYNCLADEQDKHYQCYCER